jgi:O-antigen/teichoic acid export membrane protein
VNGARVGMNSLILIASEAVRRILSLAVMFLVARSMAVEEFGVFRLSTSFMMIFLVGANFGLVPLVTKKIAEGIKDESRFIGNIQGLKILLSLAVILITGLVALLLGYEKRTLTAIVYASLAILPETLRNTHLAWYDGKQRMAWNGAVEILRSVFLLGAVIFCFALDFGIFGILTAYFAHYILGEILSEIVSGRRLVFAPPRFDIGAWQQALREGMPFLIIGIVWIVTFRVDMIILSKMRGEYSVGIYGAAYSLFEVLLLLPTMFSRALFPAFAEGEDEGHVSEMTRKSLRIFFVAALPVGAGMALVARESLRLVFGDRYISAGPTLAVMSSFLFLWFLTMGLSWALTARGKLKYVLRANVVALVVNVAANLLLIPRWDYFGAGAATVLSESVYLAIIIPPAHRHLMRFNGKIIHPGTIVSTAAMIGAVIWSKPLPFFAQIAIGAMVYTVAGLATGALREEYFLAALKKVAARRMD